MTVDAMSNGMCKPVCPECRGRGYVIDVKPPAMWLLSETVNLHTCDQCKGVGRIEVETDIFLKQWHEFMRKCWSR